MVLLRAALRHPGRAARTRLRPGALRDKREHDHSAAALRHRAAAAPLRRFDGIIAVGIQPSAHELERLQRSESPLVCVGAYSEDSSAVSIDDVSAGRIATEHLLDLGHTRIAFVGGSADSSRLSVGDALRAEGYREALSAAGLSASARFVEATPNMPGGYETAVELLGDRRRRPTAIVGVCDEVAIGATIAARRLGIAVPTELSIIGVDDHQHAAMFSLTTIRQSPREQGAEAVRLLQQRMENPDSPPERVVTASALVVRNSTSAPRT